MMYESHSLKYERNYFAVKINGRWVAISKCDCGAIHSYLILEKEPNKKVSRLLITDLTDEIRNHLLSRVPALVIPPSRQLTSVDGNKL